MRVHRKEQRGGGVPRGPTAQAMAPRGDDTLTAMGPRGTKRLSPVAGARLCSPPLRSTGKAMEKACVIYGARDIRLEPRQSIELGDTAVRVRVRAGGICGSDLHYYFEGRNGDFVIREPLIPGHEAVGIIDMSFMAKFRVQGRDARVVLDELSANALGPTGTITYTQWLTDDGLLDADVTVTALGERDFLVVATDTAHRHVQWRLEQAAGDPSRGDRWATVTDVSGALAQINVQGPRSAELLQSITDSDLGTLAYRGVREIAIGFARVQCTRITYVGELGYELFVPVEQAVHVYDRIVAAGSAFGLRHVGLQALGSLRHEKAYRDYGHDIDNTDCPLEAGFGFAIAWDKPGGFVGREALSPRRGRALHQRLVQVQLLDPEPLMFHAEVVKRNGVAVGYIRSVSYGHTHGRAVGLAILDAGEALLLGCAQ